MIQYSELYLTRKGSRKDIQIANIIIEVIMKEIGKGKKYVMKFPSNPIGVTVKNATISLDEKVILSFVLHLLHCSGL